MSLKWKKGQKIISNRGASSFSLSGSNELSDLTDRYIPLSLSGPMVEGVVEPSEFLLKELFIIRVYYLFWDTILEDLRNS